MTKATKTVRKATKTAKNMMAPNAKKRKKGFTLIELLIVVGILAVVAAVAIPNLTKFMGEGKEEAWESDQSALGTAVQAYRFSETGQPWPLCSGTTIGDPVWDGSGQLAVVANAVGMIDIDKLMAAGANSYLASDLDSACSLNYATSGNFAALTDPNLTAAGGYGGWVWYVNASGQIEGSYFVAAGSDPNGTDWDSADVAGDVDYPL